MNVLKLNKKISSRIEFKHLKMQFYKEKKV